MTDTRDVSGYYTTDGQLCTKSLRPVCLLPGGRLNVLLDVGLMSADFVYFEVAVEHFVPGETLGGDYGQERIGVKLLYVVYAGLLPLAGEEHHGAGHGGYAGGVADGLHAGLAEGCLMATVVVDIIGKGLALLVLARYAAAD